MIRSLFLALLLVPSLALAQSDTRKVALFYTQGSVGEGLDRVTGNMAAGSSEKIISETNDLIRTALDRMGVPYTQFSLPDSAGGWARVMRATRPAGTADSTWFRANGYFMGIVIMNVAGSSDTQEPWNFFTDASNANGGAAFRGVQRGSPMSGDWGIPIVVWSVQAATSAGAGLSNGIAAARGASSSAALARSAFSNGDSLSFRGFSVIWQKSPAEAANVTPIIYNDTLDATSGAMLAWRYKTSTYYYPTTDYANMPSILLGLAEGFRAAGYVPRRKLNIHMTLDHVFPANTRTAVSDSFFAYVDKYNLRFSGAIKAHANERTETEIMRAGWLARKTRWPAYPHSHVVGVGNYFQGSAWNLVTFADTSTLRQRWNFMERAISDTIGFYPARAYERTIGFPGDGVHYPHMYVFAQNGYVAVRAGASDSIGHKAATTHKRIFSRASTIVNGLGNMQLPRSYVEPISGRLMWIHDLDSHPSDGDSIWSEVSFTTFDDVNGKNVKWLGTISRAAISDADVYWHPESNLSGPDYHMSTFMRRFVYFYGRVKNIVTVEPSYRPKNPRRSSIARP